MIQHVGLAQQGEKALNVFKRADFVNIDCFHKDMVSFKLYNEPYNYYAANVRWTGAVDLRSKEKMFAIEDQAKCSMSRYQYSQSITMARVSSSQ